MTISRIGRIVAGCLGLGVVSAVFLVVAPVAGADEHIIAGTVLMAFAASWGLLAGVSTVCTEQPQTWAGVLAGVMGIGGAGLLLAAPDGATLDRAGWLWPEMVFVLIAWAVVRVRRDLHSRTRSWLVYPLFGACLLGAVGGAYQTIGEARDRRVHHAPGRLIDVGGHRLHLSCAGSGTPTVILESGLGEPAASWAWVADAVAGETQVCSYDRAGRGWSDPAPTPQDGVEVATDLHLLLARGGLQGPFVLAAHSSGAQYVRIFAGRYPEEVAGMVLLDAQPPEAFERLPSFPAFYRSFRVTSALLPSLARVGVARPIAYRGFANLPPQARAMQQVNYGSARLYRSLRDEFAELPTALQQARSFQSLGNRPLIVVTASRAAQAGWLPLQDELATLSTNSVHRSVPFTHEDLLADRDASRFSSQAIEDVVHAVRTHTLLVK